MRERLENAIEHSHLVSAYPADEAVSLNTGGGARCFHAGATV